MAASSNAGVVFADLIRDNALEALLGVYVQRAAHHQNQIVREILQLRLFKRWMVAKLDTKPETDSATVDHVDEMVLNLKIYNREAGWLFGRPGP